MMTHIFCAFAGGLITGVAVLVCPHWFSLISHAQYDDTLRAQRDLRLAAEDRLENYQEMLTQSQHLTQQCLEEINRREKALKLWYETLLCGKIPGANQKAKGSIFNGGRADIGGPFTVSDTTSK